MSNESTTKEFPSIPEALPSITQTLPLGASFAEELPSLVQALQSVNASDESIAAQIFNKLVNTVEKLIEEIVPNAHAKLPDADEEILIENYILTQEEELLLDPQSDGLLDPENDGFGTPDHIAHQHLAKAVLSEKVGLSQLGVKFGDAHITSLLKRLESLHTHFANHKSISGSPHGTSHAPGAGAGTGAGPGADSSRDNSHPTVITQPTLPLMPLPIVKPLAPSTTIPAIPAAIIKPSVLPSHLVSVITTDNTNNNKIVMPAPGPAPVPVPSTIDNTNNHAIVPIPVPPAANNIHNNNIAVPVQTTTDTTNNVTNNNTIPTNSNASTTLISVPLSDNINNQPIVPPVLPADNTIIPTNSGTLDNNVKPPMPIQQPAIPQSDSQEIDLSNEFLFGIDSDHEDNFDDVDDTNDFTLNSDSLFNDTVHPEEQVPFVSPVENNINNNTILSAPVLLLADNINHSNIANKPLISALFSNNINNQPIIAPAPTDTTIVSVTAMITQPIDKVPSKSILHSAEPSPMPLQQPAINVNNMTTVAPAPFVDDANKQIIVASGASHTEPTLTITQKISQAKEGSTFILNEHLDRKTFDDLLSKKHNDFFDNNNANDNRQITNTSHNKTENSLTIPQPEPEEIFDPILKLKEALARRQKNIAEIDEFVNEADLLSEQYARDFLWDVDVNSDDENQLDAPLDDTDDFLLGSDAITLKLSIDSEKENVKELEELEAEHVYEIKECQKIISYLYEQLEMTFDNTLKEYDSLLRKSNLPLLPVATTLENFINQFDKHFTSIFEETKEIASIISETSITNREGILKVINNYQQYTTPEETNLLLALKENFKFLENLISIDDLIAEIQHIKNEIESKKTVLDEKLKLLEITREEISRGDDLIDELTQKLKMLQQNNEKENEISIDKSCQDEPKQIIVPPADNTPATPSASEITKPVAESAITIPDALPLNSFAQVFTTNAQPPLTDLLSNKSVLHASAESFPMPVQQPATNANMTIVAPAPFVDDANKQIIVASDASHTEPTLTITQKISEKDRSTFLFNESLDEILTQNNEPYNNNANANRQITNTTHNNTDNSLAIFQPDVQKIDDAIWKMKQALAKCEQNIAQDEIFSKDFFGVDSDDESQPNDPLNETGEFLFGSENIINDVTLKLAIDRVKEEVKHLEEIKSKCFNEIIEYQKIISKNNSQLEDIFEGAQKEYGILLKNPFEKTKQIASVTSENEKELLSSLKKNFELLKKFTSVYDKMNEIKVIECEIEKESSILDSTMKLLKLINQQIVIGNKSIDELTEQLNTLQQENEKGNETFIDTGDHDEYIEDPILKLKQFIDKNNKYITMLSNLKDEYLEKNKISEEKIVTNSEHIKDYIQSLQKEYNSIITRNLSGLWKNTDLRGGLATSLGLESSSEENLGKELTKLFDNVSQAIKEAITKNPELLNKLQVILSKIEIINIAIEDLENTIEYRTSLDNGILDIENQIKGCEELIEKANFELNSLSSTDFLSDLTETLLLDHDLNGDDTINEQPVVDTIELASENNNGENSEDHSDNDFGNETINANEAINHAISHETENDSALQDANNQTNIVENTSPEQNNMELLVNNENENLSFENNELPPTISNEKNPNFEPLSENSATNVDNIKTQDTSNYQNHVDADRETDKENAPDNDNEFTMDVNEIYFDEENINTNEAQDEKISPVNNIEQPIIVTQQPDINSNNSIVTNLVDTATPESLLENAEEHSDKNLSKETINESEAISHPINHEAANTHNQANIVEETSPKQPIAINNMELPVNNENENLPFENKELSPPISNEKNPNFEPLPENSDPHVDADRETDNEDETNNDNEFTMGVTENYFDEKSINDDTNLVDATTENEDQNIHVKNNESYSTTNDDHFVSSEKLNVQAENIAVVNTDKDEEQDTSSDEEYQFDYESKIDTISNEVNSENQPNIEQVTQIETNFVPNSDGDNTFNGQHRVNNTNNEFFMDLKEDDLVEEHIKENEVLDNPIIDNHTFHQTTMSPSEEESEEDSFNYYDASKFNWPEDEKDNGNDQNAESNKNDEGDQTDVLVQERSVKAKLDAHSDDINERPIKKFKFGPSNDIDNVISHENIEVNTQKMLNNDSAPPIITDNDSIVLSSQNVENVEDNIVISADNNKTTTLPIIEVELPPKELINISTQPNVSDGIKGKSKRKNVNASSTIKGSSSETRNAEPKKSKTVKKYTQKKNIAAENDKKRKLETEESASKKTKNATSKKMPDKIIEKESSNEHSNTTENKLPKALKMNYKPKSDIKVKKEKSTNKQMNSKKTTHHDNNEAPTKKFMFENSDVGDLTATLQKFNLNMAEVDKEVLSLIAPLRNLTFSEKPLPFMHSTVATDDINLQNNSKVENKESDLNTLNVEQPIEDQPVNPSTIEYIQQPFQIEIQNSQVNEPSVIFKGPDVIEYSDEFTLDFNPFLDNESKPENNSPDSNAQIEPDINQEKDLNDTHSPYDDSRIKEFNDTVSDALNNEFSDMEFDNNDDFTLGAEQLLVDNPIPEDNNIINVPTTLLEDDFTLGAETMFSGNPIDLADVLEVTTPIERSLFTLDYEPGLLNNVNFTGFPNELFNGDLSNIHSDHPSETHPPMASNTPTQPDPSYAANNTAYIPTSPPMPDMTPQDHV